MNKSIAAESALLVMHCQNDIVDPNGLYNDSGAYCEVKRRGVLEKIAEVLEKARDAGVLIVFVNNAFSRGYPELKGNTLPICDAAKKSNSFLEGTWGVENPTIIKPVDGDVVLRNFNTSSFSYTNLDQILRAGSIEKLYLTGVATNFVVESTARYGAELNYEIHILKDCCASWTAEMHDFAIMNTLPQFGIVESSLDFYNYLKF